MDKPTIQVAVVIERERAPNAWEAWRFRVAEVLPDEGGFGSAPRQLRDDGTTASFMFPGLPVTLHADEGEGYYLNLSTGTPVWFVMWRVDEDDAASARPHLVTLSYNEAARLLDAQERVDNLPLPPPLAAWLAEFTAVTYKPEAKQRRRPASFRHPGDRQ